MIIHIIAGRFLFATNLKFTHTLFSLLLTLTHSSVFLCAVFRQIMALSSSTMPPLPSWLAAASFSAPRARTHLLRTARLSACFAH